MKKKINRRDFIVASGALATSTAIGTKVLAGSRQSGVTARDYTVAIYYWPNFHKDRYHELQKGEGWTEWEIVRNAAPKFPGHYQPKVPAWGYRDESDPKEMERNIDAMADAGIGAIIFDWYRYDDQIDGGVMIEDALRNGFMQASNRHRIKFSLMWANHDYIDCHPFKPGESFHNARVWRDGPVGADAFKRHTQDAIDNYFKQPNYWKIKGCPYFSIYRLDLLIKGLGGIAGTITALDDFRRRVRQAGFPDLHLNIVDSGAQLVSSEVFKLVNWEKEAATPEDRLLLLNRLLRAFTFDSATMYTWAHHLWPLLVKRSTDTKETEKAMTFGFGTDKADGDIVGNQSASKGRPTYRPAELLVNAREAGIVAVDYRDYGNEAMKLFDKRGEELQLTYFPHVSMGWDGSPRNYSMGMVLNNTPEKWRHFLQQTKDWLDANPASLGVITLNSWNEWVEGSYIEPDSVNGTAYLDAVKEVFGTR